MHVLAEHGAPMRFSRIQDEVEGISHKILTQCLRRLEGDVGRTVHAEVPPRVEYSLTALGGELLAQLVPLWRRVCQRISLFEKIQPVSGFER
jgi:DNA-binding HxlR family transcriptional regulator